MLRKSIIAFTALAALAGAASIPSAAAAHGLRFHHHFGWRFYAGPSYIPSDCYWVKKYGPFGARFVRVCNAY